MDFSSSFKRLTTNGALGGPPKIGGWILPPKWMVKIMVPNPMNKMDDLGVFPYFWKYPYIRHQMVYHRRWLQVLGGFFARKKMPSFFRFGNKSSLGRDYIAT